MNTISIIQLMKEHDEYWRTHAPTREEALRWALNKDLITLEEYNENTECKISLAQVAARLTAVLMQGINAEVDMKE